jgi:hypothetical protein
MSPPHKPNKDTRESMSATKRSKAAGCVVRDFAYLDGYEEHEGVFTSRKDDDGVWVEKSVVQLEKEREESERRIALAWLPAEDRM